MPPLHRVARSCRCSCCEFDGKQTAVLGERRPVKMEPTKLGVVVDPACD